MHRLLPFGQILLCFAHFGANHNLYMYFHQQPPSLPMHTLKETMAVEAARNAAKEAYVGTDEATMAVLAQVAEGVARVAEERVSWEVAVAEARGRQYSERNGTNEYSRTFTEQVNAWMEGTFPERDALVVSRTPMLYRQIGLGDLPMTINQEHVDYIVNAQRMQTITWAMSG